MLKKVLVTIILLLSAGIVLWQMPPGDVQSVPAVLEAGVSQLSPQPETEPLHQSEQASPSLPETFSMPDLGITTLVEQVGLDENKRMDVPQGWHNVGWYKYGPKPGEIGNAVLAGHLDTSDGNPAVFYNLDKLQIGDKVEITDEQGETYTFEVYDYATYPDANFPIPLVFGPSNEARLNLITCTGAWDRDNNNYTDRLVVFTRLAT